jgi:toxin ParE1/3/4
VSLKLTWHDRAAGDLRSIHDYLAGQYGLGTAQRVRAELRQSARRLARHPLRLGRSIRGSDVRILSVTRYPYVIYYTVTAVAVVILHVRHTARRAPDLGELEH